MDLKGHSAGVYHFSFSADCSRFVLPSYGFYIHPSAGPVFLRHSSPDLAVRGRGGTGRDWTRIMRMTVTVDNAGNLGET